MDGIRKYTRLIFEVFIIGYHEKVGKDGRGRKQEFSYINYMYALGS